MIKGQIHVGLTNEVLENLAKDQNAVKISRRDFPVAIAKQLSGGTTVAGTMLVAKKVLIHIKVYFILPMFVYCILIVTNHLVLV